MKTIFRGRHLITFDTWTKQEIETVIEVALDLKRRFAMGEITELLKHKTLFMIFFEQSTRTRNSLEAAMTQLGGHAHDLTADKMQIAHGESPKDTAKVLSRMGEGIAIRNCFYNIGNKYINEIAKYSDIPVISMQDDVYHPLQVIADLMTIREYYGQDLRGLKVAVSWAYATTHAKPLSVPQSQILLFTRYSMDVVLAHPKEFPLQKEIIERAKKNAEDNGGKLTVVHDMVEAIKDADIIIPKNWGGFAYFDEYVDDEEHMRIMKENLARHKDWILDSKRFSVAKKDAKIMHALPADRGHEVTDEVIDSENSIIYDEAENRLHTAKAILTLLMGGRV
ncbi:MAG TPA: ornithine carbamoyltransferase [candidate division WOR-3 bacterium]|uniref:Ornithine carbamoyltransferase n=1 Tax=candidate division WOR-3 bacterium TaxID=2052148 RepID=A0A7V5HN12_UNCW3|nr:ornithine carbamoyltransferase [candidate division WOR-3 bacterium]